MDGLFLLLCGPEYVCVRGQIEVLLNTKIDQW